MSSCFAWWRWWWSSWQEYWSWWTLLLRQWYESFDSQEEENKVDDEIQSWDVNLDKCFNNLVELINVLKLKKRLSSFESWKNYLEMIVIFSWWSAEISIQAFNELKNARFCQSILYFFFLEKECCYCWFFANTFSSSERMMLLSIFREYSFFWRKNVAIVDVQRILFFLMKECCYYQCYVQWISSFLIKECCYCQCSMNTFFSSEMMLLLSIFSEYFFSSEMMFSLLIFSEYFSFKWMNQQASWF